MRRLVVLALLLGACKEKPAPATTAGSASPPAADAAVGTGSGSGSAVPDVVVKGPAFDVPRVAPPATAIQLDAKDRVAVQIDAQGAVSIVKLVEPATNRIVKPVAAGDDLAAMIADLVGKPAGPAERPPPPGQYADILAGEARPAGRAPVANSATLTADQPIVLAAPKAPAAAVAGALAKAGGILGVLHDGKLASLRAFARHVEGGNATDARWLELHVRQDGLHVVAMPAGKADRVPWDKDSVDARALLAAIDRAVQAGRLEPRIDVLVDPAGTLTAQQLVDVLAALAAGNIETAIGVAPGAPDERAAQAAAANVKASRIPKIPTGTPPGDLSRVEIRRSIQLARQDYARCYKDELKKDPQLSGKVTVSFTIGPDGKVTKATGAGMTPAMNECVAKVFTRMRFPKPADGGIVNVNYPVIFRPEE